MKIIRLLLTGLLPMMVGNVLADGLNVNDFRIEPGQRLNIDVEFENTEHQYIMLEFWMKLPEGVVVDKDEDGELLYEANTARFKQSHQLVMKENEGNAYHILIYSNQKESLNGTTGALFSFTVKAANNAALGKYQGTIFNQLLCDTDKNEYHPENLLFNVTIANPAKEQSLTMENLPMMTYGDDALELPATTTEGLPLEWTTDDSLVAIIENGTISINHAGTTTVTATQEGNEEYLPFSREFTLTINKALLTVTANSITMHCGEAIPELSVMYEGFKYLDDEKDLLKKPTVTTTANIDSEPGTYSITARGAESDNYEFEYVDGTLTLIGYQTLQLMEIPTMTYGDAAYELPLTTDEGKPLTWSISDDTVAMIADGQLTIKNAGTATMNATAEGDTFHEPFEREFTLTVNKAMLTVTANSITMHCGEAIPELSVMYEGFKYLDDEKDLLKKPTVTTTANIDSEPGTYSITARGAESDNYEFEYVDGTLTLIGYQTLQLMEIPTMTYGDAAYELPLTTDEGKPLTWSISDDTVAMIADGQLTIKNAGTATMNATAEGDTFHEPFEREFTLTVDKAILTIAANDIKRLYYEENPEPTYTCEGLKYGETDEVLTTKPTLQTIATKESDAGTYPITIGGAEAANYFISYESGTLTINKRDLIVSTKDYSRYYNVENPEFELIYDGFVGNEDENVLLLKPTATTLATKDSDVGVYDITIDGGQAVNYELTYKGGKLTIEKAYQTLTWEQDLSELKLFDQVELSAEASSELRVSYYIAGPEICSFTQIGEKTYLDCSNEGETVIYAIQEGNNNYWQTTKSYKTVKIIRPIPTSNNASDGWINTPFGENVYDLQGRKIGAVMYETSTYKRGINIIRMSDGTSRKVVVK